MSKEAQRLTRMQDRLVHRSRPRHGEAGHATRRSSPTEPRAKPPAAHRARSPRRRRGRRPPPARRRSPSSWRGRRRDRYELVSVDAMAVYRYLDIGTAKPTPAERALAPGISSTSSTRRRSSPSRSSRATPAVALAGIEARGHVPLLVGGTGLYHRAVLDGLDDPGPLPRGRRRARARGRSSRAASPVLFRRLRELDPVAAERVEPGNRRRIVRALEVTLGTGRPFSSFGLGLDHLRTDQRRSIIGLELDRPELDRRLAERFDDQLARGLLEEVRALAARPAGLSRTARQAIGYRELLCHVEEGMPLEQARTEALRRLRAFARRQEAWFRRDPRVDLVPG